MRFGLTFLWGLFCANSWTWCIGLYLPVLLIDRFGWPGFIAFAVPNVLGCTAFGYVIKHRARSEAMVARHGAAMTWFSITTVAYHMFFVVWLLAELVAMPDDFEWVPLAAATIVLALGAVLSFLPNRDWLWLSALVYAVSLAAVFAAGFAALETVKWRGAMPQSQLAFITPLLLLGFLLCPYLDLTFHRAVRNAPSRHAFSFFGAAFTVMIVLTCLLWFEQEDARGRVLPPLVLAHILAQIVFTVGAHLREIRLSSAITDSARRGLAMIAPIAAAPLLYLGWWFSESGGIGQTIYLSLLMVYALVFPAYVLLFVMRRAG